MFGGLCFMVNDKMCVGVEKERLMLRIDPEKYDDLLKKEGCRPMDFSGQPMLCSQHTKTKGTPTTA